MAALSQTTCLRQADIESKSTGYWMMRQHVRLANGQEFNFDNHEYQREWYSGKARRRCYVKATGAGVSECEIWKTLHDMRFGRLPQGGAYWFPDNDAMEDFSKTRFGPLFALNYNALGKYVRAGGKNKADNVSVKRIGNANLYLRGARLQPMGEGDTRLSSKTSGIQVDKNVFDEVDQFDQDVIAKIIGRARHTDIGEEVYIANPSDEDYGIDLFWQSSDQRHWFRKCDACGEETCAELEFLASPEKCVKIYPDVDERRQQGLHTGFVACKKCGRPLPIAPGRWVAQKPENKDLVGYRWSHLTSAFLVNDPASVLNEFYNPPQGNLADVYRLRLGLAYSAKEDKLRRQDVLACCGNDATPDKHTGPCAMGVDNDAKKHVVVGIKTGRDRFEILKTAIVDSFNDVHDLERRYNVKSTVCDRLPNMDSALQFMKSEAPYGNKVWLCQYSDTMLAETQWNDNTQIVRAYRTGCFDGSHRVLMRGEVSLPRQNPNIEEFARQCCNVARYKEKDKRTGTEIFRYRTTGSDKADHFRNAFNYFLLACSGSHIRIVKSSMFGQNTEPQFVVNDNKRYI